jgi:4-hydroxybenzoate polyprenyltransferase
MTTQVRQKPRNFSLKAFSRLVRVPNLTIIALCQYLTAIFLCGEDEDYLKYLTDIRLLFLVLSTTMIAAAGYIINDYYDVKIDYINRPERVIIGRILKRRVAMAFHIFLSGSGVLIGLFLAPRIALLNVVAVFLLWLYSNQLKRLPFIGNVAVSLLIALAVGSVGFYYQNHQPVIYTYAFFAFGINLIREILKDMEDVKGDGAFGCRTLPIVWGVRKTKKFLYILTVIYAGSLFYFTTKVENPTLTVYFFGLLVPVSYLIYLLTKADTKKAFARLSFFCKLIMLGGMISMIFF